MKETFYATSTMSSVRLNWPKSSLADLGSKLRSKFIICESVGGPLKTGTRSNICTDWWEVQDILEEIDSGRK